MDYVFYKLIKLSNIHYPSWIKLDTEILVKNSNQNTPYSLYKIIEFRDGKYISFQKVWKITPQNLFEDPDPDIDFVQFTIKNADIKSITNNKIISTEYTVKRDNGNKESMKNVSSVMYEWEIKSDAVNLRKDLLCNGFSRRYTDNYVYHVIIQLISYYVSGIMDDIKNAEYKEAFYTMPIKIKGLEWHLEFYPNGLSTSYQSAFEVFLCLKELPAGLKWIKLEWKLRL